MDYFNNVLTNFLGLERVSCVAVMQGQKALRFNKNYLNLCSEDERRSYRFGTTWGWVINDRIFIFAWTNPLKLFIIIKKFSTCFINQKIKTFSLNICLNRSKCKSQMIHKPSFRVHSSSSDIWHGDRFHVPFLEHRMRGQRRLSALWQRELPAPVRRHGHLPQGHGVPPLHNHLVLLAQKLQEIH